MGVVLVLLLSVNQRHSIYIIILVMVVLVSSHDQLLLCSLQADRSDGLGTVARDIDISHVLIPISYILVGHNVG